MRLKSNLSIFAITSLLVSCALMQPRRQLNRQVIPKELLNSQWALESMDMMNSDCSLTMQFLDKGQLTFTIEGQEFRGYNVWYLMKDSTITFHPGIIEKFAWPSFHCKPDNFARVLLSVNRVRIRDNRMTLVTPSNMKVIFKKV